MATISNRTAKSTRTGARDASIDLKTLQPETVQDSHSVAAPTPGTDESSESLAKQSTGDPGPGSHLGLDTGPGEPGAMASAMTADTGGSTQPDMQYDAFGELAEMLGAPGEEASAVTAGPTGKAWGGPTSDTPDSGFGEDAGLLAAKGGQDGDGPGLVGGIDGFKPAKLWIDGDNLEDLMVHLNRSGKQWTANVEENGVDIVELKVSFPTAAWQVPNDLSGDNFWFENDDGELVLNFEPFGDAQQAGAIEAMERWEDVANVRFTITDEYTNADLYFYGQHFDWTDTPGAGYSTGVNEDVGSRVLLNADKTKWDQMDVGGSGVRTLIHEIGHSLGLSHPGAYNVTDDVSPDYDVDAVYVQDSTMYSIMSYFAGGNTGAFYPGLITDIVTPRTHDIYVVQELYGHNWEARDGNTTYGYNATGVSAAFDFDFNPTPILTIWDGGGEDTLDLSGDGSGVTLNLTPGSFSSTHGMTNNISLAYVPEDNPFNLLDDIPAGHDGYIENAIGGDGDDMLIGNDQGNSLEGGNGQDQLYAGAGNDELFGGSGDDFVYGGDDNDVLSGGGGIDTLVGGSGQDIADYTYSSDDWTVILTLGSAAASGGETDVLLGIEGVRMGKGDDDVYGDGAMNTLEGGGGHDILYGGGGTDGLYGGSGNDLLNGGAGEDYLIGGPGIDTASYSTASSSVVVDLDFFGLQNTGGAGTDGLSQIENLEGSNYADWLYGDDLGNRLYGGDGSDLLKGKEGVDWLYGGDENDYLYGGTGNDLLYGGDGVDTASYYDAPNAVMVNLNTTGLQNTLGEGLDLLSSIENISGSNYNDWLFGDGNHNRLSGYNGNDALVGGFGDDHLIGGAGNDSLYGGFGHDTLDGGSGIDWANYNVGFEAGVSVSLNVLTQFTGAAGVDTLIDIENLWGTDYSDSLYGDGFANELRGDGGVDWLFGGGGNDVLNGGAENDVLFGSAGHDDLIGGAGNDSMAGGSGYDDFVFAGYWGDDTITDFDVVRDDLDFTDVFGLNTIAQLSLTDTVVGVTVEFGGNTVTLNGVSSWELSDGNFLI